MIRRRDFITVLGGAAAWPLAARAQQSDSVRRIGVLLPYDENDPVAKTRVSAFTQALADVGWTEGRNIRMVLRWAGGDINRIRALAQELVGLQPDIILAHGTPGDGCPPAGPRGRERLKSGAYDPTRTLTPKAATGLPGPEGEDRPLLPSPSSRRAVPTTE